MKCVVILATLYELDVSAPFSRRRVSNDTAYAGALFRTAKYCPLWPEPTLRHPRRIARTSQVLRRKRHAGQSDHLLAACDALCGTARQRHIPRGERGIRATGAGQRCLSQPGKPAYQAGGITDDATTTLTHARWVKNRNQNSSSGRYKPSSVWRSYLVFKSEPTPTLIVPLGRSGDCFLTHQSCRLDPFADHPHDR